MSSKLQHNIADSVQVKCLLLQCPRSDLCRGTDYQLPTPPPPCYKVLTIFIVIDMLIFVVLKHLTPSLTWFFLTFFFGRAKFYNQRSVLALHAPCFLTLPRNKNVTGWAGEGTGLVRVGGGGWKDVPPLCKQLPEPLAYRPPPLTWRERECVAALWPAPPPPHIAPHSCCTQNGFPTKDGKNKNN